ncbi:MAG: hypothetical protein HQ575_06300, partial [Candidatus Omnitrophica bacterium]|nr:hypothetical protein [Candidatus Omnitrophota bacterium]
DEEESDGPQILPGSPMPNIPEIVREALTNNPGISFGTLIEEVKKDLPVPLGSTMEDVYPDLESIVTECLDEDNIANMMISAEGEPEFFSFAAALARRGTNKAIDNLKWVYQHRVAFEKKLLIVEALSETSNKRAISFLEEALRDGFTTSLDSIFSILQKQEALFGEEVAELLAEYKDSSLYAYLDIRAKAELHAKAALPDLISMAQNATAAERRIIFEAINATMKLPFSIVCDEAGKIYIVKRGNNFSSTKELLSEIALTSDSYPVGIDIGSGRGDFVPAMQEILKEVYPSAAFIGNERGSDEFDDNLGRLGIFFVGDAENLPIKDKAVQIATINNSFREKSGDYIKEAARILDRDGVLLFLPYCLWNNFRGQFVRQMLESGFTVEEVRLPEDYPRSRDYVDNGLLLIARRLDTSDELCTRRIEDLTFLLEYVQSQVVLEDKGTTEPLLSQPLKGTGDGSENTAPPSGPIGIPKGSPAHIFEMLCLQIQPLTMGEIARLKVVDRAVQTIEKDVQSLVYLGLAKKVPKEGKTAYKIITLNKREKAQVMSLLRQLGYRAYTRDLKKVEAPIGEIVKEALSRIEPKEINVHPITLRLAIILRLAKDGVMPMAGKGDFYAKDIKVIDDIASELTDVYYTSAFIRTITKVKKTQYFRLLRRLGIRRIETEDEVYLRREDAIYFASWVRLKKRYTIPRKKAKELLGVTSVAAIYALKQKIPDMVLTINRVEYLSREAVMREVKRRDVSRLIPPGYISVDELQKMLQKEFPGINKVTLDYLLRTRNEIDAIKIFNPVNKTEWNYVSIKDIEKIKAAIRGMRGAPYVQVLQIGDIRDEALYPTKTAKAVTGLPYHIFTTGVRKRRLEGVPGGKGGITTLIKGRSIKLVYALQNEDFKKHIRLLKRLKRMIEDGRLTRKDLRRDPAALKDEIDNAIMVLLNLAQVRRDEVDAGEIESSMAELQLDEETIKRYLKLPYGEVKGKAGKRIRRMPAEYEGLSLCRPEDIVDSPLLKEAPFTFEPESAYYRIQDVIDQLQIDAKMLKALIDRKILPVNEDGLIRASDFELIKEVVKNLTHDLYSLDSIAVLLDISRSTLNDLLKIEKITSRRIGIKAYVSKEDAAFLVIRKRLIDKHLFARKRAAEVLGVKPKSVGLLIWKKRLRTVMIGKVKHVTKESVYGRLHARTLPDGCISLPELLEEIKTKPLFSSVDYSTVRYAASQLRILKTGVDKRSKVRIVYVPRDKIDRVMDFIKKHSPAVRDLLSIKDIEDDEYYPIEVARVLTGLPAKTINYQLTKGNIEGVRPPGMLKHVLIKGSSIKGLYRTREPYWEALKKGKVYPAAEIAERVG